jgi:hypothetical protein
MSSETSTAPVSKAAFRAGWVVSALPVLMLVFSGVMKFVRPPGFAEGLAKIGWDENLMLGLGILELGCTAVYLVPRTAVLGAILLTGYLGGAIATHVRVGDPFYFQSVLGVLVWLGLFLRERRLHALIPFRC